MREFTPGNARAEMKAHYAAVRAKFFPPIPPKHWRPEPPPVVELAAPEPAHEACVLDMAMAGPVSTTPIHQDNVIGSPMLLPDRIRNHVGRHFDVPKVDMLSIRRTARVVLPRQIAMYLCKLLTSLSLPHIGRKFGGRDHTTVLHAVRKIERLRQEDPELDALIAQFCAELTSPDRSAS